MKVLETPRLELRHLSPDDGGFILELLNDPGWLRHIGDKGVRSLDDAREYIRNGPVAMYERAGHGLWLVQRREDGIPVGMCGLIKRDGLDDVDIGFAFLARHRGAGLALEAAQATLDYGYEVLGLPRIVAITSPANERSARLLERIGLRFERMIRMTPQSPELCLYVSSRRTAT
jgi:RimJ/RimL family protein N-acetyltransferase